MMEAVEDENNPDDCQAEPLFIQVPSFIGKLWDMLDNPFISDIISWADHGLSFVIKDKEKFRVKLLPEYFTHRNLSSFIRQLNKYGFKKMYPIENSPEMEFFHTFFVKDKPQLLLKIKRKKNEPKPPNANLSLEDILLKVQSLKKSQDQFDSKLARLDSSTKALTKETSILHKKQRMQQQIIKNIMAFLANIVQNSENDKNLATIFPNYQTNSNVKNLIAISDNPHVPDDVSELNTNVLLNKDEDCTLKNVLAHDQSQSILLNDTFINKDSSFSQTSGVGLSPSDITLSGCKSETGISPLLDICLENPDKSPIIDISSLNMEGSDEINKPNCNYSTDLDEFCIIPESSGDISDLINRETCIDSNAMVDDPSNEIMRDESTSFNFVDSEEFLNTDQPDGSEQMLNFPVPTASQSDDLECHISDVDSNLNFLKEALSDAKLNLDLNEVLDLFCP